MKDDFFRKVAANLRGLQRDTITKVVVVEAEKFHAQNFRKRGFTNKSFKAWKPRKNATNKKALLIDTGAMRRHAVTGIVRRNGVLFRFPLAYMKVHNKGLRAGRGKGFKMPKRKFVGKSQYLISRIDQKAKRLIKQKLKNL